MRMAQHVLDFHETTAPGGILLDAALEYKGMVQHVLFHFHWITLHKWVITEVGVVRPTPLGLRDQLHATTVDDCYCVVLLHALLYIFMFFQCQPTSLAAFVDQ